MDRNTQEPKSRNSQSSPAPSNAESRDEQENQSSSAVVYGVLTGCGTLFALLFGIFTILAWEVGVGASNTALLQTQIALLQYCMPNVSIPDSASSACADINARAQTALPALARSIFGHQPPPSQSTTTVSTSAGTGTNGTPSASPTGNAPSNTAGKPSHLSSPEDIGAIVGAVVGITAIVVGISTALCIQKSQVRRRRNHERSI